MLEDLPYKKHSLTIGYDKDGTHYQKKKGLWLELDGKEIAANNPCTEIGNGYNPLYLVSEECGDKKKSYIIYIVQLILNSLWTLFYFGLDMKLFAFIILIGLIISVILMILEFRKLNKTAAYLQIPYLIWLIFAGYLNLATYLLNM